MRQRLQGGPCSAPTHFILSRLQTVQALCVCEGDERGHTRDWIDRPGTSSWFWLRLVPFWTWASSIIGIIERIISKFLGRARGGVGSAEGRGRAFTGEMGRLGGGSAEGIGALG